jgi:predicted  nucleic acid-binding Zn-ribbon protein
MDIVEILKTIKEDWALLVFFFTLGGFWWQGKAWFKKINETLTQVGADHAQQNKSLAELHIKIDNLDERVDKLELATTRLHEELHDAEVQLAVLQSRDVNEDKAIRRISRRKTG